MGGGLFYFLILFKKFYEGGNMMESRIFIGSSKESLEIAKTVKKVLEENLECECCVWDKDFFELNISTYQNLYRKAYSFDYAVFVGGKDSIVLERNEIATKARDNVTFELGLYAGILSPARTFFLLDKECSILSDLKGITIGFYSDDSQVKEVCKEICQHIERENQISRLSALPSTTLAISYYYNFLLNVQKWVEQESLIYLNGEEYDVSDMEVEIKVVLPEKVCEMNSMDADFYKRNKLIEVRGSYAKGKRGVLIRVKYEDLKENRLIIYDVPTIIDTAFKAVDIIEGKDYVGEPEQVMNLKKREISNFKKALQSLSCENYWMRERLKFQIEGCRGR